MDTTQINVAGVREAFAEKCRDAAEWRREKSKEYPSDKRNLEAANLLDVLAGKAPQMSEAAAKAYGMAWESEELSYQISEVEQEAFRQVGFTTYPDDATDFVNGIIAEVADPPVAI